MRKFFRAGAVIQLNDGREMRVLDQCADLIECFDLSPDLLCQKLETITEADVAMQVLPGSTIFTRQAVDNEGYSVR